MNPPLPETIPFVDLTLQHQPNQADIEQAIQTVIQRGDFVLGQALAELEAAFAHWENRLTMMLTERGLI